MRERLTLSKKARTRLIKGLFHPFISFLIIGFHNLFEQKPPSRYSTHTQLKHYRQFPDSFDFSIDKITNNDASHAK